ncbi:uncharacterized protein LOC110187430 [Drosophila serrata]|uniref:uncharacterized protein LOC110187430 n=1 Tax=Drosophila serrata TaxID=7274 RepID=UPI000A1D1536|nr:uncharacterized protein LOC110187430 [Drosophila serrata]
MSYRSPSSTSMITVTDSEVSDSTSDSGVFFKPSRKLLKSSKLKLKLIALYGDHKCLWNECHKDFFNFDHKAKIWEAIADEMQANSPPDFWKHAIHRLRYNVDLERVQEQKAKSMGEDFSSKLTYKDHLHFLNHIFSREKDVPHREIPLKAPSSGVTLEKIPLKHARPIKEKPKSEAKLTEKIAKLDVLRNHHCTSLILTHEAFKKMQKITSGVDHQHVAREKPKLKAKHV